jgi:hypothetical protein
MMHHSKVFVAVVESGSITVFGVSGDGIAESRSLPVQSVHPKSEIHLCAKFFVLPSACWP